jgi:hypothetical protein
LKRSRNVIGRLAGKTQHPFQLNVFPDMRDQHVGQNQEVDDTSHTQTDPQGEGPGTRNLPGADSLLHGLSGDGGCHGSHLTAGKNALRKKEPIGCSPVKKNQPDDESTAWGIGQPTQDQTNPEGKCCLEDKARKGGHHAKQEIWIHGIPGLFAIAQLIPLTILSHQQFKLVQLFLFDRT